MQITGMLWGAKLLKYVGYPTSEVLGPDATSEQIKALIDRWGSVLIKPVFKGGIGKKGKAGLIGRAGDVATAMREKERLFFVEHRVGNQVAKAEGVTFEGAVPAQHEIYFSITDDTRFRAPTLTITHHGGVDIEELPADKIATIPFDALTGFKGFIVANALDSIDAPQEIISPLVQNLPRLWDLFNNYGMSMLELNPIRMMPTDGDSGRLIPVACDFKCGFDTDDPAWHRLHLPAGLESGNYSAFELEVNELRTYQGQSDVFVINDQGTITAMTFGGGANALVTELLGDAGTISSDFGGNPPYAEDVDISRIVYKHWLAPDQRAVHHRRQGQQHRHLHHLPGHGRCPARSFQHPRPPAPVRRGRPRRSEPDPRHGLPEGHPRCPRASLSHVRPRLGHERRGQLRPRDRYLDACRRARRDRAADGHRRGRRRLATSRGQRS